MSGSPRAMSAWLSNCGAFSVTSRPAGESASLEVSDMFSTGLNVSSSQLVEGG